MIYILSSTHAATGGTELLQQLCFQLNCNEIPAAMYYTEKYNDSKVKGKFDKMYHNPFTNEIGDKAIAVVPETEFDSFQKIKDKFEDVYIWWLSVDNYYGSGRIKTNFYRNLYRRIKHNRNLKLFRSSYHCVQSEYARLYLINEIGINKEKIYYLSDYINDEYLRNRDIELSNKEDIILYNPKKGYEFTRRLINAMPEYNWLPLENMNNQEMVNAFTKAKLYVDFGNHPGKDRIPREAAMFYCCIITGRKGAANNDEDIPILAKYKIDEDKSEIDAVKKVIEETVYNYENQLSDFHTYREKILSEKKLFIENVKHLFGKYK